MKTIKNIGMAWMLVFCLAGAMPGWAQSPEQDAPAKPGQRRMMQGAMPGPMHEQMRQQMRAHDKKLEELTQAMNKAEGPAKVDAIAAVVNELVAQRLALSAHRDEMRAKGAHQGMGRPGMGPKGASKPDAEEATP